jgi:hypothetical protein
MYQANGDKQALVRAFLDRGPTSLRSDEDALLAMVMAAMAATEVVGTC